MPPSEQNGIGVSRLLPQFQCLPPSASSSNAGHKSALFKPQQHSKNKRELPNSSEGAATHCLLLQPTRQPYHPSSTTAIFAFTSGYFSDCPTDTPFYTFSWEQRKLSEITDKVTEKNAGLQYVETFTNSAEFGIISQRDFFDHDIAKLGSLDGYYIVKNEDFVYNPRISTSAPVGPINRNKLGRTGVMSPLYTVFRPHDIDTTYLEYFFKCGYWHSFMNFNGDSGARSDRFSIRDNVFFQMPIPIPDIDEQRKIGELLTCLDNLITLHQRQTIVYAVIRSIRKVILAERQYFAPPMVRKSP